LTEAYNSGEFPVPAPVADLEDDSQAALTPVQLSTLLQVAERVMLETRCSGAAIAWGNARQMLCVASTGDCSPPIGAQVDPSSGLARECIRSGKIASCPDSALDVRVSHEACRALNIASLLYCPILSGNAVVGLLGAFAATPSHFTDTDIANLLRVCGVVPELLRDGRLAPLRDVFRAPCGAPAEEVRDEGAEASDTPVFATSGSGSRLRVPMLTAAAVGLVIATAGWVGHRETSRVQAKPVAPPSALRPAPVSVAVAKPVPPSDGRIRVVIDPGHGGRDQGATSPTGLLEKDLTLDIAQRLETRLKDRLNCEVVLTRSEDKYVALEDRAAKANDAHADFLISIHGNSSSYDEVRGIETYYFRSTDEALSANDGDTIGTALTPDTGDAAKSFASDVQSALLKGLKEGKQALRDRGVKPASFVVLREVQMPAVLAEISFMSSSKDATQLDSSGYRDKVAEALYAGIANHLSRRKPPATALADATVKHDDDRR
jgi:N-acetylmuramoyl-L-alanine amidase